MKRPSATPTKQELEILKIIWQRGSASVRDVYEAILRRRKIAYTTVMTMMKIMEQKRYLKRRLQGRAYIYQGTRPKKQMIREMVGDFINRVFDGSAHPLLAHLVEDRRLSENDLKKIAKMTRDGV